VFIAVGLLLLRIISIVRLVSFVVRVISVLRLASAVMVRSIGRSVSGGRLLLMRVTGFVLVAVAGLSRVPLGISVIAISTDLSIEVLSIRFVIGLRRVAVRMAVRSGISV
jgi:hypothetical protein